MSRRVAIIQSSYIPWRGLFAIIARCDVFVFLDSVQFTRRDWRTRNRIKTANGPLWLSIPVQQKGNYLAPIDAIQIAEMGWSRKHLRSIHAAYARSPAFGTTFPALEAAYRGIEDATRLSEVNQTLTASVCRMLGIATPLLRDVDVLARDRLAAMDPTERLVALAAATGATEYLSGPSARTYLDETRFADRGMGIVWMDYASLPEYPQIEEPFDAAVSIVDVLLTLGTADARGTLGV